MHQASNDPPRRKATSPITSRSWQRITFKVPSSTIFGCSPQPIFLGDFERNKSKNLQQQEKKL